VGTLPGVTEAIMVRCMNADYQQIADRTHRLCAAMAETQMIRVSAPSGTEITLPMKGRQPIASTGLFRERGQFGNLPTGEAYLAPLEGESNGVVVVDGSMAGIGVVSQPIRIFVKDGQAADISGGPEAAQLVALLEPHGRDGRNVAEFGIGTNDRAQLSGVILEDEKVMGTIHIAFGDNKSMGGRVGVASHLDGLVKKPTVWFDDRLIMESGRLLVE
jgi:leucyl aminopeptidase (aminopeptidase T)